MTHAERLAAARALYAERKHFGPLESNAPDRPTFGDELTALCACGRTVVPGGIGNHLRGAAHAHIAGVFRVYVREVAHGIGNQSCVSRAIRRAGESRTLRPHSVDAELLSLAERFGRAE